MCSGRGYFFFFSLQFSCVIRHVRVHSDKLPAAERDKSLFKTAFNKPDPWEIGWCLLSSRDKWVPSDQRKFLVTRIRGPSSNVRKYLEKRDDHFYKENFKKKMFSLRSLNWKRNDTILLHWYVSLNFPREVNLTQIPILPRRLFSFKKWNHKRGLVSHFWVRFHALATCARSGDTV